MLAAMLTLTLLATLLGLVLGYAARRFHVEGDPVAERIDALLPQTQCGQCGYPGCKPYAAAIAADQADINKCAPGGNDTIAALAELLGREPIPMDASIEERPPSVAVIIEKDCIGCTLCIQACPVDAILGATKLMHTVIASECTGCELCLPPCPVECIVMEPITQDPAHKPWPDPANSADAWPKVANA
jgi:electron transport complex protein RnfB